MPSRHSPGLVSIYFRAFDEALRCTWPVLVLPTLIVLALNATEQGRDIVRSTHGGAWAAVKFFGASLILAITMVASCVYILLTTSNQLGDTLTAHWPGSSLRALLIRLSELGVHHTWADVERAWNIALEDPATRPQRPLADFFPEPPPARSEEEFSAATGRWDREFSAAKWMAMLSCWIGLQPLALVVTGTVGPILYTVSTIITFLVIVVPTFNTVSAIVFFASKDPFADEYGEELRRVRMVIPYVRRMFQLFTCGAALGLLGTAIFPVEVGRLLGSDTVVFLAAAFWIGVVAALTRASRQLIQRWSIPAFSIVVLFAIGTYVAVRFTPEVPAMRCIDNDCTTRPGRPRVPVGVAITDWDKEASVDGSTERPIMIIIAAAGGGIRAAYWTGLIVGHLQDTSPSFHRRIFAISAVSGGSLGAATYTALVARGGGPPACRSADGRVQWGFAVCARTFMEGDFLAPNIAAILTGEVLNAPVQYLTGRRWLPGRDVALERAWEAEWRSVFRKDNGRGGDVFARAFDDLWWDENDGRRRVPALLLNGTSARTGDRTVVSNFDAREFLKVDNPCAVNVSEHANVPLSTAVNASARFPYVEPPGRVTLNWKEKSNAGGCTRARRPSLQSMGVTPDQKGAREAAKHHEHDVIVDGGYYDNFGAATALDLLDHVERHVGGRGSLARAVRVVVIQITSDPTARFSDVFDASAVTDNDPLAVIGARCAKLREPSSPEALMDPVVRPTLDEPLVTLMRARARVGTVFARELRRRAAQLDGHYFHFGLREDVTAPLGWTLSRAARRQIDEMLIDTPGVGEADAHRLRAKRCNVQEQLKILIPLLRGEG